MHKSILLITIIGILFSSVGFSQEPAKHDPLKGMKVVKISPRDEAAVIRTPEGKMEVIRVGDSIGSSATVKEIANDAVVIENRTEREVETVIIRLAGKKQTIQRIRKLNQGRPNLYMPAGAFSQ